MSSGACQSRWPPRRNCPWARCSLAGSSRKTLRRRPPAGRNATTRGPTAVVTVSSRARVARVSAAPPRNSVGVTRIMIGFAAHFLLVAPAAVLLPRLAHQFEDEGAAGEPEGLDQPGLEVAPVRFGEFFLPVAEQLDAEGTVAGLGGV